METKSVLRCVCVCVCVCVFVNCVLGLEDTIIVSERIGVFRQLG